MRMLKSLAVSDYKGRHNVDADIAVEIKGHRRRRDVDSSQHTSDETGWVEFLRQAVHLYLRSEDFPP